MDDIVEVWFRGRRCFVNPMAFTTEGFRISTAPFAEVPAVDPKVLGAAVRAASSKCCTEVAHPTDWDAVLAPLYEAAGLTEREFCRGAVRIEIALGTAVVRVSRWVREGGGFSPDAQSPPTEMSVDCSDDQLGAAVLAAVSDRATHNAE